MFHDLSLIPNMKCSTAAIYHMNCDWLLLKGMLGRFICILYINPMQDCLHMIVSA